jgi:hypothetical protein
VDARDLFFRAKLRSVIEDKGARIVDADAECDLAVIEVAGRGEIVDRIRQLVGSGVPVLAFGSHKSPDLLREVRDAGAEAVPNSEIERRLRARLEEPK